MHRLPSEIVDALDHPQGRDELHEVFVFRRMRKAIQDKQKPQKL